MKLGEYNKLRGWKLPDNEDGETEGYLVEYLNGGTANTVQYSGYVSWTPKEVFEQAYRSSKNMTFGDALTFMKQGAKVARAGWNGKGMFIYRVPANKYPTSNNPDSPVEGMFKDNLVPYGAYYAMKTADNNVVPWLCSQTDMEAEDWCVVD
jgi:hypothetical protein